MKKKKEFKFSRLDFYLDKIDLQESSVGFVLPHIQCVSEHQNCSFDAPSHKEQVG